MNTYTIKSYILFIFGMFFEITCYLATFYKVTEYETKDINDDDYLKVINTLS